VILRGAAQVGCMIQRAKNVPRPPYMKNPSKDALAKLQDVADGVEVAPYSKADTSPIRRRKVCARSGPSSTRPQTRTVGSQV
jgi:hypothetical protein